MFVKINLGKIFRPGCQSLMTAGTKRKRFIDRHRLHSILGDMLGQRRVTILTGDRRMFSSGDSFGLVVMAFSARGWSAVDQRLCGLLGKIVPPEMTELTEAVRDQKGADDKKTEQSAAQD